MSYSLGTSTNPKLAPTGTGIVSEYAERNAELLMQTAKRLKGNPFLRGVTYDPAKFRAARVAMRSKLNQVAGAVGMTTMNREEVQQYLLGAINLMVTASNRLRIAARVNKAALRPWERLVMQVMQRLASGITQVIQSVRPLDAVSGMGILPLIALQILIYGAALTLLVDALDSGEEIVQAGFCSICGCNSERCTPEEATTVWVNLMAQNAKDNDDPFGAKSALEDLMAAAGTVLKVVGIGAAVVGGVYLLWTFGPLLIGAGRKVRKASKRKLST